VGVVLGILATLLLIYTILLVLRLIFGWIQAIARDWRPRGFVLALAETAYTLTDPPIKFLRKFIKPIRLGPVMLDLSFMIVFLACSFGYSLLWPAALRLG
jgi:YggT family protein